VTSISRSLREIAGYGLASAVAFAIDLSLLALLVALADVPYLAAAAASFVTGTIFVYWASINHIFGYRRVGNVPGEFGIFLIIGVVGLALNLTVMHAAVERLGLHYLLAKIVAACFTFGCNYGLRRALLFTQLGRSSQEAPGSRPAR